MAAFPNPNMAMGQFNQMAMNMKGNMPNDRGMQNMSSKDIKAPSLNNMSRDSRNGSRVDLNSSRKNASNSKNNLKGNKSYQVALNDDINLIERIEVFLNQITLNHNKVCPFCSKSKFFLRMLALKIFQPLISRNAISKISVLSCQIPQRNTI